MASLRSAGTELMASLRSAGTELMASLRSAGTAPFGAGVEGAEKGLGCA